VKKNHLAFIDTLTQNLVPHLPNFLDTTVFGYRCFDRSGKSFGWSNNNQWNHFFINNLSDIPLDRYEKEVASTNELGKYKIVRIGLPTAKDKLFQGLYQLKIWNTVCCYIKCGNYIEGFYFSNPQGGTDWINHCLNQHDLLENYCIDFKKRLLCITSRTDLLEFSSPTVNPEIFNTDSLESPPSIYTSKLTIRENQCLKLIGQGLTNKKIAHYLNLSPRTVEWHVENLKNKLNANKKINLIEWSLKQI
jgi:DNA-binding CsgD family transcriptional regulator